MPAALRSIYTASVALAGVGVIAVSPLAPPAPDVHIPTVAAPTIELAALSVPALGAIPYQVLVNQLGSVLAIAPILLGSTDQCTACLGPTANPALMSPAFPFTGWGAIGIGAGLIASPIAFVTALGDGSVTKALGAALLAIQVPITNTLSLLKTPRIAGGFALDAVPDRAFQAAKDSVDGLINIAAQALVTGPLDVFSGAVGGALIFAATLASTGNVINAINAGRAPFEDTVNIALTDLTNEVQKNRSIVYADLTGGPGAATSPIPTIPPPAPLATAARGPVTKVTNSVKAVPNALSATTAGDNTGGTDSAAADDTTAQAAPSGKSAKSGVGGSKRQHKAQSAE